MGRRRRPKGGRERGRKRTEEEGRQDDTAREGEHREVLKVKRGRDGRTKVRKEGESLSQVLGRDIKTDVVTMEGKGKKREERSKHNSER